MVIEGHVNILPTRGRSIAALIALPVPVFGDPLANPVEPPLTL